MTHFDKGTVYIGPFVNNKKQGKNGKYIFTNGDTYEGDFFNGMRNGIGKTTTEMYMYEGNF